MKDQTTGRLFLLPAPLQEFSVESWDPARLAASFPALAIDRLQNLDCFIVESEKTAYRLLSRFRTPESMKELRLSVLDEHSTESEVGDLLSPLLAGEDVGFFSEAGMPCIADPGAALVAQAHSKGIRVLPVTGPSSILLALVASGLDAQRFMFLGYLPAEKGARKSALLRISRELAADRMTRLFIETPYRNEALARDCLENLHPDTWLAIASDLCGKTESIRSKPIGKWRLEASIFPGKSPAVFAIGFPASPKPKNTV
jgi:16S rRNA (cytidine1402-2'-O)-methyltransferase